MKNKRREKKCDRRKLVGIGVVYSVYILYLLYHSCNSSGLFVSYFPALLFIMLAASEINIIMDQFLSGIDEFEKEMSSGLKKFTLVNSCIPNFLWEIKPVKRNVIKYTEHLQKYLIFCCNKYFQIC